MRLEIVHIRVLDDEIDLLVGSARGPAAVTHSLPDMAAIVLYTREALRGDCDLQTAVSDDASRRFVVSAVQPENDHRNVTRPSSIIDFTQ